MSTVSLNTIHTIERESNGFSLRISAYGLRTLSFLKRLNSWSFKFWFSKKLITSFDELTSLLSKINDEIETLSVDEIKELYAISSKTLKRFLSLKESLEEIGYFNNDQLKDSLTICLDKIFITEAKTKKIAKRRNNDSQSDDELKKILALRSKKAISTKI